MHIPHLQHWNTFLVHRLHSLISSVINHLLTADPRAQDRLRPHAGKTLVFTALGVDLPFDISPDGLLRAPQGDTFAADDAHLHITLEIDALRDAIAKHAPLSLSGARVRGDAELAQTLSWLLAHVRWDVEDDLAQLIGDIPAHRLARAGQSVVKQGRQAWERGQARARDWFASSPRALVSRNELSQLQEAVRDLRDRTDRLEKRIALLRQQMSTDKR